MHLAGGSEAGGRGGGGLRSSLNPKPGNQVKEMPF